MYNRRHVVGICTAKLDHKFHAWLSECVMKELTMAGCYVIVFALDSDLYLKRKSDTGDAAIFDLINFEIVDSLLIFSETIYGDDLIDEIVQRAKTFNKPVFIADMHKEGCFNIKYNTIDTFEQIVRHVIEYHGVREVNFISGIKDNPIAEERLAVYKKVIEENDIPFEEERVGYGNFWDWPTRDVMDVFMAPSKVPPEAIICANDSMAVTVCDYLKKMNINVPEDIIVVGFDGIDEGKFNAPGITTGARDEINDAKKIVDAILEGLETGHKEGELELNYHVQLSQSCGCQMAQLYDSDRLISRLQYDRLLKDNYVRRYADMAECILECETEEDFIKVLNADMPKNSFICVNQGLNMFGKNDEMPDYFKDTYTPSMKAYVRFEEECFIDECFSLRMVPELGKDMSQELPVILYSFHFSDHVIGFFGFWLDQFDKIDMLEILHFLRALDNTAGYRFSL